MKKPAIETVRRSEDLSETPSPESENAALEADNKRIKLAMARALHEMGLSSESVESVLHIKLRKERK